MAENFIIGTYTNKDSQGIYRVTLNHVADVETWRDMIAAETLALSLEVEAGDKLAVSVAKH